MKHREFEDINVSIPEGPSALEGTPPRHHEIRRDRDRWYRRRRRRRYGNGRRPLPSSGHLRDRIDGDADSEPDRIHFRTALAPAAIAPVSSVC